MSSQPFFGRPRKQAAAMLTDLEAWHRDGSIAAHLVLRAIGPPTNLPRNWKHLTKRRLLAGLACGFCIRAADHIHLIACLPTSEKVLRTWLRKNLRPCGLRLITVRVVGKTPGDRYKVTRYCAQHLHRGARFSAFGFARTPRRGSTRFQWREGRAKERRDKLRAIQSGDLRWGPNDPRVHFVPAPATPNCHLQTLHALSETDLPTFDRS